MKTKSNLLGAIFAACVMSVSALAADPSGTWKFQAEGPNGRSVDATLTLKWENNQLTGQVDNRAGVVAISDARFVDDQVSFSVVREIGRRLRKKTVTVNYTGKLEGDTIKGAIETTGRDDKAISIPWIATRAQ